jgi:hypothetical protein
MKFRTTWIVLGLALLLGSWVYLHEVVGGHKSDERRRAAGKLLKLGTAEVTAVRITHSETLFDLQKRSGQWFLLHPVVAPCDPATMQAFLDTLTAARIEDELGRGDYPRYGLDAPAAKIEVDAGGQTQRLQLGRINPQQTFVYGLVNDSKTVVLTTSSLLTYSLASAFGWRDKHMIEAANDDVQRIVVRTLKDGSAAFRHDPQSGWRLDAPVAWRLDPVRALAVALGVSHLEGVGIAAENKAELPKFGLDNRRFGIELHGAGDALRGDLQLGFADGSGAYFGIVADKPEIFKVDAKLIDTAISLVTDPRDRKALVGFDPQKIDEVRVLSPDDRFTLKRRSSVDWKVTSSTKVDSTFGLATGAVDGMLTDLLTLQVAGFPASQPVASTYDPAKLAMYLFSAGREVSGLEVGSKDPHGLNLFARGPREPAVFYLSPTDLLRLPFDLLRLKADIPAGADSR